MKDEFTDYADLGFVPEAPASSENAVAQPGAQAQPQHPPRDDFADLGFVAEDPRVTAAKATEEANYTDAVSKVQTVGEGLARGASFGFDAPMAALQGFTTWLGNKAFEATRPDDENRESVGIGESYDDAKAQIQKRKEYNKYTAGASEIVGMALPMLASAGTSTAANIVARGPTAALGRATTAAGKKVAGELLEEGGKTLLSQVARKGTELATQGAIEGAVYGASKRLNDAYMAGDYDNLAEKTLAGAFDGAALGFFVAPVVGGAFATAAKLADGLPRLASKIDDMVSEADDFGSEFIGGRAYKAALGGRNLRDVQKSARIGGPAEIGKTLLDEGIVTPTSTIEDIAKAAQAKSAQYGQAVDDMYTQLDSLGVPPSGSKLWTRIDDDVIRPLKASPAMRDIGEQVEAKLQNIRDVLTARDAAPVTARGGQYVGESAAYKINKAKVLEDIAERNAAESAAAAAGESHGNYVLKFIPIEAVDAPQAWSPSKMPPILKGISDGAELPPIRASLQDNGRFAVEDGIHRVAASREAGLKYIPAIVDEFVPAGARATLKPELITREARKALTFRDLWQLRRDLDQRLKWEQPPAPYAAPNPALEGLREVRRVIRDFIETEGETVARASGDETFAQRFADLNRRYSHVRHAEDIASKAIARDEANRFLSPSDYGVGGLISTAQAIAGGGPSIGTLAYGFAAGLVHKAVRERGSAFIASTLYGTRKSVTAVGRKAAVSAQKVVEAAPRRFLESVSNTANKLTKPITSGAVMRAVDAVMDEARQLLQGQGPAAQGLQSYVLDASVEDPQFAQVMQSKITERAAFLVEKAGPQPLSAMGRPMPYDPVTKRKISRYVDAVTNPVGALDRVASGAATGEDRETLQTLYPAMWDEFVTDAMDKIEGDDVSFSAKIRASLALGLPLVDSMSPENLAFTQSRMGASNAAAAQSKAADMTAQAAPLTGDRLAFQRS